MLCPVVDQGTCPNGHAVDLDGGRFCEICGLAATCPNGHPVTTPDAAFCDQCQLPIGAAPAPPGGSGFSRQVVLLAGLGLGLIVAVVVVILVLASGGDDTADPADPDPPAAVASPTAVVSPTPVASPTTEVQATVIPPLGSSPDAAVPLV